jgi:type IV secretion system protein TrbG
MSTPRNMLSASIVVVALSACATRVQVPEIPILDSPAFKAAKREPEPKQAVQYVEVPKPLPLPGQLKPVPKAGEKLKDERSPKERVVGANAAARIEPVKDGYINAIQVYPYTKGALYQLYAAVNQVTDIALEPGEKLVSVSAGDTVRWVVGDTSSGEGKDAIVHILVKPIGADLETNLLITTDRRTYHLEMRSSQATYMASVSWTYPASELISLRKQRAEAEAAATAVADTGVNLDQLRFRYRIEGDAPWKPRQVFDDGAKVYIQFPSGLAQSEAPPLFVIGPDGKPALVNYRVRGTTYIVDRLFAAAELRLGTAPQHVVRIVRTDAVWRETQP